MRYYALTLDEVLQVVTKWKPARTVTAVHLHHTIAPRRDSFSGAADLERLAEQTASKRLPQHLTIDGAGLVWTGRHWDLPPASVANQNGDRAAGPFAIALAGDFNHDRLEGAQLSTAIALTAEILRRHKLSEADVVFHRDLDEERDCPGARVNAAAFRADVRAALARPPRPEAAPRVSGPFAPEFSAAAALLEDLGMAAGALREPQAAEAREAIGLLQAIHFLIRPKDGTRNIFSDNVSDPLIEKTVHALGGVSIWGNMKQAAERAAAHAQGGSNLVAQQLAALMARVPALQVHTIGHSAGAIFQAHSSRPSAATARRAT